MHRKHRKHPVRAAPGPRPGPRASDPPGRRVTLSDLMLMTARAHSRPDGRQTGGRSPTVAPDCTFRWRAASGAQGSGASHGRKGTAGRVAVASRSPRQPARNAPSSCAGCGIKALHGTRARAAGTLAVPAATTGIVDARADDSAIRRRNLVAGSPTKATSRQSPPSSAPIPSGPAHPRPGPPDCIQAGPRHRRDRTGHAPRPSASADVSESRGPSPRMLLNVISR
jgi:hypothetical protein